MGKRETFFLQKHAGSWDLPDRDSPDHTIGVQFFWIFFEIFSHFFEIFGFLEREKIPNMFVFFLSKIFENVDFL